MSVRFRQGLLEGIAGTLFLLLLERQAGRDSKYRPQFHGNQNVQKSKCDRAVLELEYCCGMCQRSNGEGHTGPCDFVHRWRRQFMARLSSRLMRDSDLFVDPLTIVERD